MHYEPSGRGTELRQVLDVDACSGCRRAVSPVRPAGFEQGWTHCDCLPAKAASTGGHVTLWCHGCRSWTYDPPHDGVVDAHGSIFG